VLAALQLNLIANRCIFASDHTHSHKVRVLPFPQRLDQARALEIARVTETYRRTK
jgi:hypothetical protein